MGGPPLRNKLMIMNNPTRRRIDICAETNISANNGDADEILERHKD